MFCSACGASNDDAARFCSRCGLATTSQTLQLNYTSLPPAKREVSQVRPWVRYWARFIDMFLFAILCGTLFGMAATPDNVIVVAKYAYVFFGFGIYIAWMFIEAIFLSVFKCTPGKWLLGTSVELDDGSTLSYLEALSRSGNVWFRGLAAGVPLIAAATQITGYKTLKKAKQTTWDRDGHFVVVHQRIGPARTWFAIVGLVAVFMFGAFSEDKLTPLAIDALIAERTNPDTNIVEKSLEKYPTPTHKDNIFDQFDSPPPKQSNIYDQMDPKPAVDPYKNVTTPTIAGGDDAPRCTRWSAQTGQCLEWITLPAGYHWDNAPLPSQGATNGVTGAVKWDDLTPVDQAAFQVDEAAEVARWGADALAFAHQHPSLTYQRNTQIMQEHLNSSHATNLTNLQRLDAAFYAAEADSRWSNGP